MATGSEMYYGDYQFTPVPIITNKSMEVIYTDHGERNFIRHTMELSSSILSPAADSGRLDYLFTHKNNLINALASGAQEFRIYWNGLPQMSGVYPRVGGVSFSDDVWVDRLDYSFSLEWEEDFYSTNIQSYTDTWAFEEQDDRRVVLARHDVSAVGIDTNPSGTNNAFTNAKTYVLTKTGWANAVANTPGFATVSGTYSAYEEHTRTESVDPQGGSYAVSEVFLLSSGTYIDTYNSQLAIDNLGISTLTITGNVKGVGRGDDAYDRALAGWSSVKSLLPSRASGAYSELGGDATLYTTNYQTLSTSSNEFAGTVDYSVSYTDSGSANLPSGILDFSMSVQDNKAVRLYASFAIAERALGNVVQDIATPTEGTYTINGTAVGKPSYPFASVKNYVETQVNNKRPNSANYETLRLSQQQVGEDENNNTVTFNLVWTYTKSLGAAAQEGYITI